MDQALIDYLKEQKKHKYTFENCDKKQLVHSLLSEIGHQDPEIRDGLIYSNLAHLLHDNHFSKDELIDFTSILLDDAHLFYDIGNEKPLSVLTRSFSILQLVIIVYVHRRDSLFTNDQLMNLYHRFLDYFKKETVLNGYDNEYGFMHSIAHAADLFSQLVQLEEINESHLKEMFQVIGEKYKTRDYFFSHDEDERMVVAIKKGLERKVLSLDFLIGWVEQFSIYEKDVRYPEMYFITNNVKLFLRSLYFALLDHDDFTELVSKIKQVLKENVSLR